jgi:magnesium transporter
MQALSKITNLNNLVGKEITLSVPTISPNQTVDEVTAMLQEFAKKSESINYLYVLNSDKKLVGVVSVKELLRQQGEKLIKEIMVKNLVVSHAQVQSKRAAHLAIKHNIKAMPIVDSQGKFLGALTSDKLLDILHAEHRKEILRAAGIISISGEFGTILQKGIWHSFISRLPWIIIGLIGGIFSAQVVRLFEPTLSKNLILASFIPLIVYIGNAVGIQTQTFFVRDIAFNPKLKVFSYSIKQLITSGMIGVISGLFIWFIVTLITGLKFIGLVIGLAAFSAITASTVTAILVPYIFALQKKDPATGSGPFTTILQDLLSLFVYFAIAAIML